MPDHTPSVQDYAMQAVKGIKESFDNAMLNKLEEYKDSRLFDMKDTSEFNEIFTSTEGLTGSKELTENETPPLLALEDGYSVTLSDKRFGGAIQVNEKMMIEAKDNTTKIDAYIQRQRNALLRDNTNLFLNSIFAMYNEAFDDSSDYLAPDGVEICGVHEWKTGGTFTNKTTAVLDSDAVDEALEYGGDFTGPDGSPVPISFDTIVVKKGSAAARDAKRMFAFGINPTKIADINIYEGEMIVIETPYITAANKKFWFLLASNLENPLYVGINEAPQMREPIRQNNEAVRSNCTGFWKQGVNNLPFAIYGSDGTESGS